MSSQPIADGPSSSSPGGHAEVTSREQSPPVLEFHVESYLNGVRVDTFLNRHLRNHTPFRIQRMVRAGVVWIDDQATDQFVRVFKGQAVRIRIVEPPDKLLPAEDGPLHVLFEDPWLLVVNKPAGQLAHPVGEHQWGTLANIAQSHLDRQTTHPGLLRPGLVHRLDRETSGILVLAKEHFSHRQLSVQFQRNEPRKMYLALVHGVVGPQRGTVRLPIGRAIGAMSALASVTPDARDRRPAETLYRVVERFASHTLVLAQPMTGRMHQIRVHLAALGHPIVGDAFYGEHSRQASNPLPLLPGLERHALHACRMEFSHPVLRTRMTFNAELPDDLRSAVEHLRSRMALATS